MIAGRPTTSSAFSASGKSCASMRVRDREADLLHRLAEKLAVLRLVDGVGAGADHLDAEPVQHAVAMQGQRGVERRLPAHGRQQRHSPGCRPLALDHLGHDFRRDRLDIGRVRQFRIGHDRRRIGIHQDDPVSFGAQRLARLGAGIVEFASLADDDRAGADDQNRFDVGAFGHQFLQMVLRAYKGNEPSFNKGSCAALATLPQVRACGACIGDERRMKDI